MVLALLLTSGSAATRPTPSYAAVALKPGDFIVSSSGGVKVVDPTTGEVTALTNDPRIQHVSLVATTPSGDVYAIDDDYKIDEFTEGQALIRIDPATGLSSRITTASLGSTDGLISDRHGQLFLANASSRQIVRINPVNLERSIVASGGLLSDPKGIAIEADGSILTTSSVSASASSGPRQLVRIRTTGQQQVVSTGGILLRPFDVSVGPDGSIFLIDYGTVTGVRLIRIDPASGAQETITSFGTRPVGGIVADSPQFVYVIVSATANSVQGLLRIDLSSRQQTNLDRSMRLSFFLDSVAMVQTGSPLPCPTRSPVSVQAAPDGSGRLRVHVHAAGSPNRIREIRIGEARGNNAIVDGTPVVNGADATFFVRRTGPGAVTLPFVVSDACGDWPTFVGGGPNAF